MTHRARVKGNAGWLLLVTIVLAAVPAAGQFPDKFTNLQVLPKDISKADLQSTMRGFAFALNVRCPYCHAQKPDKSLDFASDDMDAKKTARVMLQMVAAINHDYLPRISKPNTVHVECVTCHRGLTQPRQLGALLAEAAEHQGSDGAIKLYSDLRKQFYGTGEYDFGERPLNQLAESLLAKDKNKDAAAIMELNFAQNHPESAWAYHVLGMSHEANSEIEKAKADYRKDLELHPEDGWAKDKLEALSKAKP